MDDQNFDEKTALDWIQNVEKSPARQGDIYAKLKNWIDSSVLHKILEIGCGQGIRSEAVELKSSHYIGIEPSEAMVNRAQQLYGAENKIFLQANAYDLPFAANSFDAVFSILVLHLLSDLEKSTFELARVLRPEGKFFIITANPAAIETWMGFYSEKSVCGKRLEGKMVFSSGAESNDVLYFHSLNEIRRIFFEKGLEITEFNFFRPDSGPEEKRLLLAFQGYKITKG